MVLVESAGITDKGKKRKVNEDAMFLDDTMGLYVVADGMGGHQAGEIASNLVVKTISEFIRNSKANDYSADKINCDKTLSKEANRLLAGILLSNKMVHETSRSAITCRGMGSTISAVYFTDDTLISANVGDSPIFLIRNGKVKLLSVPHTVLAEQAAHDPENADRLAMEYRHVLTRAMGTEASVQADIYEIQCFKGDIIVISSDGLSDKTTPREILETVTGKGPNMACLKLVALANERGGDDNVTTIVLKVKGVNHFHKRLSELISSFKQNVMKFFTATKNQVLKSRICQN
jgi:PPM family protein phosphatase